MANEGEHDDECPYEIVKDEEIFRGRWMGARQVDFVDKATGSPMVWQSAFRPTKISGVEVDGVDVIATLIRDKGLRRHFVFVKQYRIPINGFALEFPADENETIEEAGLRELKEETGYTATRVISCTRGRQPLNPGLADDTVRFMTVEIDGDLPENDNTRQQLDDGEHAQVVLVPCDSVLQTLDDMTTSGVCVEAMLYSFAIGYNMSAACS